MQRVFTTVTLLGLLVATAAAFAITEHLKLIKSPVFVTEVSNGAGKPTKLFSPVCRCPNSRARITIRLRHHDHVTVTIVDADSQQVATIASDKSVGGHAPQHFVWDGRTADGTLAPDGVYHPWVTLSHARWTGRFTNNITLDTTPPEASATGGKPDHVFFAGPGRTVAINYTFSKNAHAVVYLGLRPTTLGRTTQTAGQGQVGGDGWRQVASRGDATPSRSVRKDRAGNRTPAEKRMTVKVDVRYVELTPERVVVHGGSPFRVHVETAARRYTWRLGKRHGSRHGKLLRLRAPTTPGHVQARRHGGRAEHDGRGAGAREVSGLAQLGGPVACIGLAILLVARTRRNRIAGLGFAGARQLVLAVSRSPDEPAGSGLPSEA